MSTINSKNVQVGTSGTASQNFTLYQPATPDGTVRLGVGNSGATTLDAVTVTSAGNVTVSGSLTATTLSGSLGDATATSLAVSGATTTSSLTVNNNAISAVNSLGFRNRIINGGMVIAQRGTAAVTAGDAFPVDRFKLEFMGSGGLSAQQVSDAPAGFTNSIRFTVTTTDSSVTGIEYYQCTNFLEGFNTSDFGWGTASAQAATLSFWVKASQTGIYSIQIANASGSRCYPSTYTINSANTWEYKTVSIPATTAGAFSTDNSQSFGIRWGFAYGPGYTGATLNTWGNFSAFANSFATPTNSMMGTSGATWQITGVQLEVGTVATPFERRDYGRELIMCQRYFQTFTRPILRGTASNSTALSRLGMPTLVTMRAAPTLTLSGTIDWFDGAGVGSFTTLSVQYSTVSSLEIDAPTATGSTVSARPIICYVGPSTGTIAASSEL